jgi:hypothetical protein
MNALHLAEAARDWLFIGVAQRVEVCGVVFAPGDALQALQANPDSIEAQRDYFAHGLATVRAWAGGHGLHHRDMSAHIIGLPKRRELVIVDGQMHIIDGKAQWRERAWTHAQDASAAAMAGAIQGQAQRYLERIEAALDADPTLELEPLRERDGMLWADATLADVLEAIDSDKASELREAARGRWASGDIVRRLAQWFKPDNPTLAPGIMALARAHWQTHLEPNTQRAQGATTEAVLEPLILSISSIAQVKKRDEHQLELWHNGQRVGELEASRQMATLDPDRLQGLQRALQDGPEALGTLTGQRLLRHLILKNHAGVAFGLPDARLMKWGSVSELASELGLKSNKAHGTLQRALFQGDAWQCIVNGTASRLWIYEYQTQQRTGTRGGAGANFSITLGPVLAPGYGLQHLDKGSRKLVPVTELPAFIGANRWHPAQALFQLAWLHYMSTNRQDIAEWGGVRAPVDVLERLAASVALPRTMARELLPAWTRDADDSPAFLERVGRDIYHIADNDKFGEARAFLEAGARRSADARAAGKLAARRRQNR